MAQGTTKGVPIDTDGTMAANSDQIVPSQKAVVTYVAAQVGGGTVTSVGITDPAAGITSSGGPITTSGSITLALANDLASLEALSGTDNIYYRSGADTWTSVTIGSGLSFSGGTLATTGGSGTVTDVSCTDGSITVATGTTTPVLSLVQSRLGIQGGTTNIGFSFSAAAGAGTVTLTDAAGATPSASTPVSVTFQDGDGSVTTLTRTSTLTMTLTSGATLGADGTAFRAWVVVFNNAGSLELGVINCRGLATVYPLCEDRVVSSTAMSSGADSAGVFYSGNAVTSKYYRVLGYFEIDSLTPGTWVAASRAVLYAPGMHLPGDTVQIRKNQTGSTSSGTTTIPFDNTTPQNTEGTEFLTQAITPTSAANMLDIDAKLHFSSATAAIWIIAALFRDSTAGADAATTKFLLTATEMDVFALAWIQSSTTTSSTTLKVRAGPNSAATCYFNSVGGSALFNGAINSYLQVKEIMA